MGPTPRSSRAGSCRSARRTSAAGWSSRTRRADWPGSAAWVNGRADWVAGLDSAPCSGMPRGRVYSRVPAEIDRGVSHVSVKMLIHGRRLLNRNGHAPWSGINRGPGMPTCSLNGVPKTSTDTSDPWSFPILSAWPNLSDVHHGGGSGLSGDALMFRVEWLREAVSELADLWIEADSPFRQVLLLARSVTVSVAAL